MVVYGLQTEKSRFEILDGIQEASGKINERQWWGLEWGESRADQIIC